MPDVTITVPASATVDGRLASDIHAEQNPQLPPLGSLWERKEGGLVLVCESLIGPGNVFLIKHEPPHDGGRYAAAGFAAWVKANEALCVYPAKEGGGA